MAEQTAHHDCHDRAGRADDVRTQAVGWRSVSVAGCWLTGAVREVLHEAGMQHRTLVRCNTRAEPPYPEELLRVEEIDGTPLTGERLDAHWHQPPYALPLRLARYAALSSEPDVLDCAVIGTRGSRSDLVAGLQRTGARLVEDAIVGTSRGQTGLSLDIDAFLSRRVHSGRLDYTVAKWHTRLFAEWWSVGMTATPLADIVRTGATGAVHWLSPERGRCYLADPFPWPGTDRLLCEEMPFSGGHGRIVALAADRNGTWRQSGVVLESGEHHSYPCAVGDGDDTYLLPEATNRGATTLYRLVPDQEPIPLCAVAPGRRLADPTLFKHGGLYWIACTDIDIGLHDNLCLLYADRPAGPWQPHRCTPVKIDVCGARPAGPLSTLGETLFRPGQDCARTYGAGVVIHRVDVLSPETYRETVVARLSPEPSGPFPDGLHTLAAGQEGVWIDGKRFVLDVAGLRRKIVRLGRRIAARSGGAQP